MSDKEVEHRIMERYKIVINRLFDADEWLKSKGINDWDMIRGKKAYTEYHNLLKELDMIQRDLKKHSI